MSVYDEQPSFAIDAAMGEAYRTDLEAVLGSLSTYQQVLDLGAGTGIFTAFLAPWVSTIMGVDRAAESLAHAQHRVPAGQFAVADLESPGIATHCGAPTVRFDLVTARYVIHELADPIATFTAWKPLLAPGGHLVLIENCWQRTDWGWSDWGKRSDHLPLACTQTWATAVYCVQAAGLQVTAARWMQTVNRLEQMHLMTGFRLYVIVATMATDSD